MKKVDGYKPECCYLCREYIFNTEKEALKHESECERNEANRTCLTCRYYSQVDYQPKGVDCMAQRYIIERSDKPKWNCEGWKRYIEIPEEVEKEIREKTKGNIWLVGSMERKYYEKIDSEEREEEKSKMERSDTFYTEDNR